MKPPPEVPYVSSIHSFIPQIPVNDSDELISILLKIRLIVNILKL
jgi:hypothetical protein